MYIGNFLINNTQQAQKMRKIDKDIRITITLNLEQIKQKRNIYNIVKGCYRKALFQGKYFKHKQNSL